MITSDLLQNRINNFWGYGSLESPVWIIGIEEKYDDKKFGIEMLERQFSYANEHMQNGMINADRSRVSEWEYLANMEPFLSNGKSQRTWHLPLYLYLYFQDKTIPSNNDILEFQRNILADGGKNKMATLELSPLPAFSANSWFYNKYEIPELKSRNEYQKHYLPRRAEQLREMVKKYAPKLIIFYSSNKNTHLPRWAEVVGKELEMITDSNKRLQMYFAKVLNTSFCIIPQPGAGVSYNELHEYADKVKDRINL